MDCSSSNKQRGEARLDRDDRAQWVDVSIPMKAFECHHCCEPLTTMTFECQLGHYICLSCREKILGKKCPLCSTSLRRSFGIQDIIKSMEAHCSNAKYGCRVGLMYYLKEQHEQECPYAPCFCPESDCNFAGPTDALLDHLTTQHKLPSTILPDSGTLSLHIQPGLNVLRPYSRSTEYFFLINMSSRVFSFAYTISFFCVQPNVTLPKFTFRCEYNCPKSGSSESSRCVAANSSLSEGLPEDFDFAVTKNSDSQNGIMVRTTIQQPSSRSRSRLQGKGPTPALQRNTHSDSSDDDDNNDDDDIPSRFNRALQRKSLFYD